MLAHQGAHVATSQAASDAGGLVDERTAAAFLGYTTRALQNWRLRGGGPRYVKVSEKSIRYQRRDLQAWIEARLCDNTAMGQAIIALTQQVPQHRSASLRISHSAEISNSEP